MNTVLFALGPYSSGMTPLSVTLLFRIINFSFLIIICLQEVQPQSISAPHIKSGVEGPEQISFFMALGLPLLVLH